MPRGGAPRRIPPRSPSRHERPAEREALAISEAARSASSTEHPRRWIGELLAAHRAVLGVLDSPWSASAQQGNAKKSATSAIIGEQIMPLITGVSADLEE